MNLPKTNTTILRELLKLSERKETLVKELEKIESQIISLMKSNPLDEIVSKNQIALYNKKNPALNPATATTRKRAERGTMKKQIIEALAAAGPLGMKIPELSKKIAAKSANIHVWFSNTGKKLPEIEHIGPGHFRLRKSDSPLLSKH